ncbi:pre-mRNA-processing factor 17 [Monosporozyma servazzii]
MELLSGYASDSESESDVGKKPVSISSNDTENTTIRSKRYAKLGKVELKRRRLQRKGKGPWGSWSSSEEEAEEEANKDGHHSILKKDHLNDSNGKFYEDEDNENEEDEIPLENETSTLYDTEYKTNQSNTKSLLTPSEDGTINLHKPALSFKCYLPKRILHTYDGHIDGCNALKFIPKTGHLFISGGNDDTIKLWNFYGDRKCVRDYKGHSKAVKTLTFVNDGSSFISSSFDQTVKVWDTESGKVTKRLKFKSIPNAVDSRPLDNGNEIIVGLSNSKIMHYDIRVHEKNGLVQQYDHHLSSILALKYFPDGSKFISSSEDKTVRIWNNQINIPIKQISDTTQHSMPTLDIHPSENYFCTQSMDNSIYSYSMKPKYKRHPNKVFRGQKSSGYGIGLTFSPDGHYVCSGDIRSKMLIWDWTTTKLLKTIAIPGKKPITQVTWHPQETSKILCTGVDGKIYMLD